jgi:hypothetical protein
MRYKASQAVFAAYLNTSPSTVWKWGHGQKKPNGPSLKLLNLATRRVWRPSPDHSNCTASLRTASGAVTSDTRVRQGKSSEVGAEFGDIMTAWKSNILKYND